MQEYRLGIGTGTDATMESFPYEFLDYDPGHWGEEPARQCISCLEESDVVVVSVGVGQLATVARLIARSCLRPDTPQLHLLAFENSPNASRQLLASVEEELRRITGLAECPRKLTAHAAIPDRACTRRWEGGSLVVQVESFGEILLEQSAQNLFAEIPEPAPPVPYVRYIPSEAVSLGEMRKFWLVNGTHTVLGILCAVSSQPLLNEALTDDRISTFLRTLQGEWVRVLQTMAQGRGQNVGLFSHDELAAHAERMFDRLKDLPDFSVRDVLKELTELGRSDRVSAALHRLLQKLDDRLAQPILAAAEAGGGPVPVSGLILARGIDTVRRYADTFLSGDS